jgi:hypothetical protein
LAIKLASKTNYCYSLFLTNFVSPLPAKYI